MQKLLIIVILIFCCPLVAQQPDDRVAFVIGNSSYPGNVALVNPVNDANAIAVFLKSNGFQTTQINNLSTNQIPALRQQLEKKINRNSVLFIYYAGHGIQFDGRNYLLPIDTRIDSIESVSDDSLYLGDILATIEKRRPKLAVVILDACRDNPFKDKKNIKITDGLARVDPPSSTVVFYATRPGGVASDGEDGNGLFTKELLKAAKDTTVPIEVVFRRASSAVYKASKGEQEPWVEGVIREEFVVANAQAEILTSIISLPTNNATTTPNAIIQPNLPLLAISEGIKRDKDSTKLNAPIETVSTLEQPLSSATSATATPSIQPSAQIATELVTSTSTANLSRPISWEVALRNLKEVLKDETKDLNTLYTCHDECVPYKEWAAQLRNVESIDKLKESLKTINQNSKISLCEFDIQTNKCLKDDVKITIVNLLSPIQSHFIEGMKLTNPKVTNSGGLSFDGSMLQGARFFGLAKNYIHCAGQSGRLEFLNETVDLNLSRSFCLALVPVPVTAKLDINVLIADPENKQFIVKWNWGMVAVRALGTGNGIARLTIE